MQRGSVRRAALVGLAGAAMVLPGCLVAGGSQSTVSGKKVSGSTIRELRRDNTSEADVYEILGEPNKIIERSEGEKTLVYQYRRVKDSGAALFLIFAIGDEKREAQDVYVRVIDGMVDEVWVDSTT